jgi:hypothetical protein
LQLAGNLHAGDLRGIESGPREKLVTPGSIIISLRGFKSLKKPRYEFYVYKAG